LNNEGKVWKTFWTKLVFAGKVYCGMAIERMPPRNEVLSLPGIDQQLLEEALTLIVDLRLGRGYTAEGTQLALDRMVRISDYIGDSNENA
jgi:hypothetical protein